MDSKGTNVPYALSAISGIGVCGLRECLWGEEPLPRSNSTMLVALLSRGEARKLR
jgi:hypothetical protein